MTITYSCIANGRAILAELALTGSSYQEAAAKVLRLVLLKAETMRTIQIGSYVYHTLSIDGITYLCATDNGLDTVAPSAFLRKILKIRSRKKNYRQLRKCRSPSSPCQPQVSDFFTRNPLMSQELFFPSNVLAADFQQILAKHMMEYNKNQSDNSVSTVRSHVADVKGIMLQTTDTVLERENLNLITSGTEDPQTTAEEFEKNRKVPRMIWWKCFKKIVIITFAILLSIIIILLSTNVIPT